MNDKSLVLIGGTILILAMSLLLVYQGTVTAREQRMIYIFGHWQGAEVSASIEPRETTVRKETTVLWFNDSQSDVIIRFLKGKECKEATSAAPGWNLKDACYITNYNVPPGGTASAVFNNIGRYDYEVEYVGKNHIEKGSITVATLPAYPE